MPLLPTPMPTNARHTLDHGGCRTITRRSARKRCADARSTRPQPTRPPQARSQGQAGNNSARSLMQTSEHSRHLRDHALATINLHRLDARRWFWSNGNIDRDMATPPRTNSRARSIGETACNRRPVTLPSTTCSSTTWCGVVPRFTLRIQTYALLRRVCRYPAQPGSGRSGTSPDHGCAGLDRPICNACDDHTPTAGHAAVEDLDVAHDPNRRLIVEPGRVVDHHGKIVGGLDQAAAIAD